MPSIAMSSPAAARPALHSPDLPFVHDLGPAELRALQAQAAGQSGLDVFFRDALASGGAGPELAVLPAGRFEMGAPADDRYFGDLPQRYEQIDRPYAIGRYTITAEEFDRFAAATGYFWHPDLVRPEGRLPAMNIRLAGAQAYLAWLSRETGQRYRLPSEAEWEYAARAGSLTAYCFGDRLTCGEANIHSIQTPASPQKGWRRFLPFCAPLNRACEVGSYPANVWGLYEVHGNVWEFTSDYWYGPLDALNTVGRNRQGQWLVVKGGSWFEGAAAARAAARKPRNRDELDLNLGLRVVREIGD